MNPQTITRTDQAASYVRSSISAHRANGDLFAAILKGKTQEVKFSAHAEARLKSRNIEMTPERLLALEGAINKAEQKGSRDSLVLLADLAFIVNVPNRTVVTAMDGDSVRDNVFSNIDSAVIAS